MKHASIILLLAQAFFTAPLSTSAQEAAKDPFSPCLAPGAASTSASQGSPILTERVVNDPQGKPYFPVGRESYYTKYLAVMKEPSLLAEAERKEGFSFRFTWLRSFHQPIAVRIWSEGESIVVKGIITSGRGGDNPGAVLKTVQRTLTLLEWNLVESTVHDAALLKPLSEEQERCYGGTDGAQWIFERRSGKTHEMLSLWCPTIVEKKQLLKAGLQESQIRDLEPLVNLAIHLLLFTGLVPEIESDIY